MGDKSNANDGRMGRVSVSQRVSKKVNDAVQRGARNFRYASNRDSTTSQSSRSYSQVSRQNVNTSNVRKSSSGSMNTLFNSAYSKKGGKNS